MLVIRSSDGTIRWMDVSAYLSKIGREERAGRQILFSGEAFTAAAVQRLRDRFVRPPARFAETRKTRP